MLTVRNSRGGEVNLDSVPRVDPATNFDGSYGVDHDHAINKTNPNLGALCHNSHTLGPNGMELILTRPSALPGMAWTDTSRPSSSPQKNRGNGLRFDRSLHGKLHFTSGATHCRDKSEPWTPRYEANMARKMALTRGKMQRYKREIERKVSSWCPVIALEPHTHSRTYTCACYPIQGREG